MSEELEKKALSIIPQIVWNELEGEQKEEIKKAIEDGISVSYHHNDRKLRKNPYPSHEVYANFPADTDVITIIGNESICSKRIMLRATSERGVTSIDNPIPENIPYHVWEQFPDVFKEEIMDISKDSGPYFKKNIITYIPKNTLSDDQKRVFHLSDYNDFICIESRVGFSGSVIYYDAKNGLPLPYGIGWEGK